MPDYYLNTAPTTLIMEGNAPESPVYPGDTNADAVWTPQPIPDWSNNIVGINGKHQDADGSGLVDEADLDIVEVNYRRTNADYQYEFYQNDALQLTPEITQAQNFGSTSSYEMDINLGNNAQGATSIHGVSFSLDLSPLSDAESYTTEISNTNSWLAPSNVVSVDDDNLRRSDFAL